MCWESHAGKNSREPRILHSDNKSEITQRQQINFLRFMIDSLHMTTEPSKRKKKSENKDKTKMSSHSCNKGID